MDLDAQTGQVGGMLEEPTSFLRALTERGIDQTLTDDGVALTEGRGQEGDILEADPATIDEVLIVATPVGAARDRDLSELARQPLLFVVEGHDDLSEPGRCPTLATGEDHVFRFFRAECIRTGLAEHPADGIGDVRLAGSVGPDDCRDAWFEHERRFRGKAFEPVQVEPGELGFRLVGVEVVDQAGFLMSWCDGT